MMVASVIVNPGSPLLRWPFHSQTLKFYWMFKRGIASLLTACGMAMGLLLVGGGCVSSTARYYMPMVAQRFPPKPDGAIVPILEQTPKRPFTVIGKFAFETDRSLQFIYKSLQYNARKNGADAVIMRSLTAQRQAWMNYGFPWAWPSGAPGWVLGPDGSMNPVWYDWPVFSPGYGVLQEYTVRFVQAEMIVFR